jgi:hypothetical protein
VNAVGCRTLFSGLNSCLFLLLCKFVLGVSRSVEFVLHPTATLDMGLRYTVDETTFVATLNQTSLTSCVRK